MRGELVTERGTQGVGGPARAPPARGDAEDSGRLGKHRLSNSSLPVPQHFAVTWEDGMWVVGCLGEDGAQREIQTVLPRRTMRGR